MASTILILVGIFLTVLACKESLRAKNEVLETEMVVSEEETKTAKQLKEELSTKGFEVFDYVDEETKDTVLMQQYFIAFLKRGPKRSQNNEEADSLQALHVAHLGRMYEEGYADI